MERVVHWFLLTTAISYSVLHGGGESSVALPVVILDGGDPELRGVTEVAAGLINNSSRILPGYHLDIMNREGGCGFPPFPGLAPFPELWGPGREEAPAVVGIIGPACSSSVLFAGSLLARDDVSPINIHMAESHLLECRENYPKSFGIAGSLSALYYASIQLIKANNWTKVNVFYDESHLSSLYNFDQSLRDDYIISEYFVSNTPLTYIPLNESKRESRITFLFLNEEILRKVLCLAFHSNTTFPAYQFVVANSNYSAIVNNPVVLSRNRRPLYCLANCLGLYLLV